MSADQIPEFIDRLYREGAAIGEDGVAYPLGGLALTRERGRFLRDLCHREGARTVLEIGMAWGLATLWLSEALVGNGAAPGAHVVVDPFQTAQFHRAALNSIRTLGLATMVEFHEEFSAYALPLMAQEGRAFDLVFIDGSHRFDDVFVDLFFAHKLLKPGGLMVFDDTWSDSIFLACRYLETNYAYELIATQPPPRTGRKRKRLYRGQMRAYRKLAETRERGRFDLVPFYDDFTTGNNEGHRLRGAGMLALRAGDTTAARQAFRSALRLNPRRFKNYLRYFRTFLPAALARALSGRSAQPASGKRQNA